MKKTSFIIPAMALLLLSSCYEGWYAEESRMVGTLTTMPANINEENKTLSLNGEIENGRTENLCFQLSRTKDFSSEASMFISYKDCQDIPLGFLGDTYYYRLCTVLNTDTVCADNIQTFTVDNRINLSTPEPLDNLSYRLVCTSDFSGTVLFQVSTDADFKDFKEYYPTSFSETECTATLSDLSWNTTYYVKAIREVILGTVESDVKSFTTETAGIKSVTIYGNGIDGQPIKDNLIVVLKNMTTQEWSMPYNAVYDEAKKDYEILDFDYTVDPNTVYLVAAVTSDKNVPTIWDNSGYVVFGNDDYQNGIGQVPICWGINDFSGANPYIKLGMEPWTAQVRVEYPASWGVVSKSEGLVISDKNKTLPGSMYNVQTREAGLGRAYYTAVPYGDPVLSEDGSKYSFIFNIFPTKLSSTDCTMLLYLANDKKDVPCPDLDIQMGRQYVITFEDDTHLEITDITVKAWEAENAGSIIINPNK